MRLFSCLHQGAPRWGVLTAANRGLLCPTGGERPADLLALIERGLPAALEFLRALQADPAAESVSLDTLTLLAPIPRPRKNVICLGLNYLAHARESLAAKGEELAPPASDPVVFTKSVTAVNGPYADVVLDPAVTSQLDWEAELGFVIGRGGRHIDPAAAPAHVFGYLVINDLSARDVQFRHKQFFLGKSLDGCCPMGPYLVTADEIPDPQALDVRCWVNGVLKQQGNTREQIFTVADTVSRLSRVLSLEPGDIVSTGTPEGVGFARQPPEFLRVGDVVECEVEGLGRLRNRIVAPL